MTISVSQTQGRVPVTILSIQGDLDGSNYQDLIAKAQELYQAGTRRLILDMTDLRFMSSSGIVALHSIALLMRGDQPPDPAQGWAAFHAVARDSAELQQHVKLLNPQPRVDRALEVAGLKTFFEIHTDLATAVASF